MKKILILLITGVISFQASAQLMSLGFVKNCMTYERAAYDNELFKKHFFEVEKNVETAANPLLTGGTSYSNEKTPANGEIKILSKIADGKKITEIWFVNGPKNNYDKNFTEVYNQMVSFFNDQTNFKCKKYDTDVIKFTKDKVYYYVYKIKEIPVIVVANYKLDDTYFK